MVAAGQLLEKSMDQNEKTLVADNRGGSTMKLLILQYIQFLICCLLFQPDQLNHMF